MKGVFGISLAAGMIIALVSLNIGITSSTATVDGPDDHIRQQVLEYMKTVFDRKKKPTRHDYYYYAGSGSEDEIIVEYYLCMLAYDKPMAYEQLLKRNILNDPECLAYQKKRFINADNSTSLFYLIIQMQLADVDPDDEIYFINITYRDGFCYIAIRVNEINIVLFINAEPDKYDYDVFGRIGIYKIDNVEMDIYIKGVLTSNPSMLRRIIKEENIGPN